MDTDTVLKIISLLDARITSYESVDSLDDDQFGAMWALINFRDYLQGYIEYQLNSAETNMSIGE